MAKFRVEKDGQTFEVDVPEGQDPTTVISQFTGGAPAPLADEVTQDRTTGEQAVRGLGLGARTVVGAIPKLATGVADLAATVLNVPIAGLDKLGQAFGDEPLTARLPTSSTASLDEFLNRIFPEPETLGERVVATGGEIALTGGLGGAALAPKAVQVAQAAKVPGAISQRAPGLAEEIGLQFARRPGTFSALEATGGGGAAIGAELAEEADASPGGKLAATVGGGLAGVLAPQTGLNVARRGATALTEALDTLTKGEVRAARTLQEAAGGADEAAVAAVAARDAPEGVLPARATEKPGLQALEKRVLDEDPTLATRAATELEEAETRTLTELTEQFGPTSNKAEFQQTVIERAAAPGTKIKPGQPDEMLDDAARSFDQAYAKAEGFEIRTQDFTEPGITPLRTTLQDATTDTRVIAGDKTRKRISTFLTDLLDDVSRRGPRAFGPADAPVTRLLSEDLIEMRQIIRQEIRDRSKGVPSTKAKAEAKLLTNANDAITRTLESQLPPDAATALRATDTRYKDFVTVQDAVLRSGEKGLTPEALRASVKVRASAPGQVARGQTGDLGRLAETGKDVSKVLGKPDEASRIVRGMDAEQLQVAKADFNKAIVAKSTSPTTGRLDGKKYLAQIEKNRETLKAAKFTDAEISNMEQIGKALRLVQGRSPKAVEALLQDNVGRVMNLMAAIAGSKGGIRILKLFGSAGTGPSLILAQFGSKTMRDAFKSLSVDKADAIMRAAFDNKELMAALLTKPTASLKKQADAARTIKAFLAEPTKQISEIEGE